MNAPTPEEDRSLGPHVEEVMDRVAESSSARGMERDDRPPLLTRAYVLIPLVLLFLGVWGWNIAQWGAPPEALPPAEEENVQRVSLFVASRVIESYRSEHGRLPVSLEEAGLTHPAMEYRREGEIYTIQVRGDHGSRTYRSSEGPDDLLADLREEREGNP
jgi:hypothetical protein